jgi:hypothetical protein
LNRALVAVLHDPVQDANGLPEARAFMVREMAQMRRMVERTGIHVQP